MGDDEDAGEEFSTFLPDEIASGEGARGFADWGFFRAPESVAVTEAGDDSFVSSL